MFVHNYLSIQQSLPMVRTGKPFMNAHQCSTPMMSLEPIGSTILKPPFLIPLVDYTLGVFAVKGVDDGT